MLTRLVGDPGSLVAGLATDTWQADAGPRPKSTSTRRPSASDVAGSYHPFPAPHGAQLKEAE